MGSVHSRADIESWSIERVAELVGEFGEAYKQYGQSIRDNGIVGSTLLQSTVDVDELLTDVEIAKASHKARCKFELTSFRKRWSDQGAEGVGVSSAATLEAGTVLAENFELEKKLGSGGMGLVWRAQDKTLYRQVAIKFAKSGGSVEDDRRLEQRMKQEVKAVAQCCHPNIMTVFSSHLGDNEPVNFVVCAHLGDISLQTLLSDRSPRLSPHNLLVVAEQLLQALSHMHSKH